MNQTRSRDRAAACSRGADIYSYRWVAPLIMNAAPVWKRATEGKYNKTDGQNL